jgi:hypothetical protein
MDMRLLSSLRGRITSLPTTPDQVRRAPVLTHVQDGHFARASVLARVGVGLLEPAYQSRLRGMRAGAV